MAPEKRSGWLLRLVPLNLSTLAILVAAISLIVGQFGGLFWPVPTILVYILWALNNAWQLIIQAAIEGK